MRKITHIVLHCAATQPNATVASIQRYWRVNLGWKSPGYHYLIDAAGTAHRLQHEDLPSNGVAGHNANSIHVSYIGGIDPKGKPKDTRTPEQLATMVRLLRELRQRYPKTRILGHRDFPGVNKACPSFDVKSWVESQGFVADLS
jgi:N-acetylmuramoyl-L-alanine amidase